MSFDAANMVEDWVMGNDKFLEDYTYSEWTALDPVSGNKMLLGPSTDEFEELGAGFDDYEIFNRVKDGDN
ncbi:hypothetical protein COLO4_06509 [Corchorus olitorius]|uniref:Uncharacterized protein n=1 Tax=Corchorus olitorius TaxID=93759 RepID=A0A1R3KMU6_9ROSI|nr:hypothetical protein COLO4_06509 [Corchorus olitorius]